mmetsp:Transcript_97656/g.273251  ORF Transcript_97656/g.273251 Transcript_97656/m.273251 type:complete len:198 (+) Transcript_97656:76-669(+)
MLNADMWNPNEYVGEGLPSSSRPRSNRSDERASFRKPDSLDAMLELAQAADGCGGGSVPLARKRGPAKGEGWSWCRPKAKQPLNMGAPPEVAADRAQLTRSLTSPSMLTEEGKEEALRVFGARPVQVRWTGERKTTSTSVIKLDPSKVPRTCNQMYGARAHEAQPPGRYVPKSTCDVCQFVDEANKSKTPYCAQIRF